MRTKTIVLGACLTSLLACSGCSMWSKDKSTTKKDGWSVSNMWQKEYQVPTSMAAIWSPDVLTLPGHPPTRGFGGRVYLYNELSQAIPVEGDLVVHGYLSQGQRGEAVEADKTFGFTAEQLTAHFSPSELGASYSIWIPWDAADGVRQEITLIPTFKDAKGNIVQGSAAKLYLPGRSKDPAKESQPGFRAQTVSYSQSTTPTNPGVELPRATSGLRTTTIDVPADTTLVKNRRPSLPVQRQSFTLGAPTAAQNTAAPTALPGVSVGGQADQSHPLNLRLQPGVRIPADVELPPGVKLPEGIQLTPQSNSIPNPTGNLQPNGLPQLTPEGPLRELRDLSPPSMSGRKLKSPIAHKPFSIRDEVQPASYSQ